MGLFIYPPTAMLGAILFTVLLGGAIGANLRADSPLFSHMLFGVYLGIWTWVALWLRSPDFWGAVSKGVLAPPPHG